MLHSDDQDRDNFIERLGDIVTETETFCFAWALFPNHAHIILRSGQTPLATVMRRLLTGYAGSYNRRHRRHGHLFQNRYKSILCQEDTYLLKVQDNISRDDLYFRIGCCNEWAVFYRPRVLPVLIVPPIGKV